MNIFALDSNPEKAAEYHCDKHVMKMLLESAQLLSTMVHVLVPEEIKAAFDNTGAEVCMWGEHKVYKPTHQNHPCAVWLRSSSKNIQWLIELSYWLNYQSEVRWHKPAYKAHAIVKGIEANMRQTTTALTVEDHLTPQPFTLAMPANIVELNLDPVTSYRLYYASAKRGFATWSRLGKKPYWWDDMCHHANSLGLNKAEIKESA